MPQAVIEKVIEAVGEDRIFTSRIINVVTNTDGVTNINGVSK